MNSFSLRLSERGTGNREILANQTDKDLERLFSLTLQIISHILHLLADAENKSQANGWVFWWPRIPALGLHFSSSSVVKVLLSSGSCSSCTEIPLQKPSEMCALLENHAQAFGGLGMAAAVFSCLQPM